MIWTPKRRRSLVLLAGDVLLIPTSLWLVYGLLRAVGASEVGSQELVGKLLLAAPVLIASHASALYLMGLYAPSREQMTPSLLLAVLLGTVLSSGFLFFVPGFLIGRQPLLVNAALIFALLAGWRMLASRLLAESQRPRRLALAGDPGLSLSLAEDLRNESAPDYVITKVWFPSEVEGTLSQGLDRVERCGNLTELLASRDFDAIGIDTRSVKVDGENLRDLIDLSFGDVEVHDLTALHKSLTGRYPGHALETKSLLGALAVRGQVSRTYLRTKRMMDVLVSASALAVCALPMLLIGLLVRLESPGPALFVQERLGYRRRPFPCIKFRTMRNDAERETGPVWAAEEDPRITPLGRFLRGSRLDELPQLLNVLTGDMTLVGPRPIRAHFADLLAQEVPFYELRFLVRPGLTGWSQVSQPYVRSNTAQEEKFRYELYYLENCSVLLDLYILMRTLRVVLERRGS